MDELREVNKFRNEDGHDHYCDENEALNFGGQLERGVRIAVLKICAGILDRSVKVGHKEELQQEVESHKWLDVYHIHSDEYSAEIYGMRRDIITAGVTVRLGDMLNGKFMPSDIVLPENWTGGLDGD
jgi:hypothetical protein